MPPSSDVLSGIAAITAGETHTCALTQTGSVRCWGDNQYGQLGNDWIGVSRATPLSDDVLTEVQAIATGESHTCVLMKTGGVRCWGDNYYGQLGDSTTTTRSTPPSSDVLTGVQVVATGDYHTCALTQAGGVRCWGRNAEGQLGDGTTTDRSTPPSTDVLTGVAAIAASAYRTCALMATGGVRCWRYSSSTPPSSDLLTGVQAIATGESHTCALMQTGGVRCWGDDYAGQLGDGGLFRATPVHVVGSCE